jgi:adenine-specific DNA-methyltransferase
MTKEQKFYNALKDVFIGAKVEGESGYINLMRIKSRYYERGVFPKLCEDVEKALKPFPHFRDELFDKLYTFFSRYFSESGSIYFRYTPLHQNVYEKVYTDDKDVMLFYKTHMLYYVKTDRLFKNLEVEIDGQKFFFDVSALEHKKANEKREIIYSLKELREDETLAFTVAYSEKGKKTKIDEILKSLKKSGFKLPEELLERAFRVFEKQSEVDYFINKNAKAFLQEQFSLWLYQYVFSGESEWTETRIRQLQTLKDMAFKIIAFISQFEDELVKIWNKPKFVLNSNYVITIDKIADKNIEFVERLLKHPHFKKQIEEWQELGIVDGSFKKNTILLEDPSGKNLNNECKHLPIDTKYFKDLEHAILGMFDNLDEALDGRLIKSENYHALNTLSPKYNERVKCIYIDPPYNTGSDEFIYKDKYQHSSWLTMMADRLNLATRYLQQHGVLLVSIDEVEAANLQLILDQIVGRQNYIATFVWEGGRKNDSKLVSISHEYIICYAKNLEALERANITWGVRKEGIDDIYRKAVKPSL